MKIFWSWQADTRGRIGRFLIRDALREAIEDLKETPDIEERTSQATRDALHLDQDVSGVPGSPDLVPTIFGKIDKSAVIVADVTLVGQTPARTDKQGNLVTGKKLINSNVAIELGYALRALTDKYVLLVFNESFGKHEDLPFDLRHKGGAITFSLAGDANTEQIRAAKRTLRADFVRRLKPYVSEAERRAVEPVVEAQPTFARAAYFDKYESLATVGEQGVDEVNFTYQTDRLCYLRLIPTSPLVRPVPIARLKDIAVQAPVLHRAISLLTDINTFGAVAYDPATNPPRGIGILHGSTQLFENGELWSVSAKLIVQERQAYMDPSMKVPFVPSLAFERGYIGCLEKLCTVASLLSSPAPWRVEAGITGVAGTYITVEANEQWGPIRKPEVFHQGILNGRDTPDFTTFLVTFFSRVFDAAGYPRPGRLNGFP
jgi:hypothetical protein